MGIFDFFKKGKPTDSCDCGACGTQESAPVQPTEPVEKEEIVVDETPMAPADEVGEFEEVTPETDASDKDADVDVDIDSDTSVDSE